MPSGPNADVFLAISREVFAPIYPYYAARFLERSGIACGICLDMGCGGGALGMEVAQASACSLVMLDNAAPMLRAAIQDAEERGLAARVMTVLADVHAVPIRDGSVDLIVSRGSFIFWDDLPGAFREIRRVLAPGGWAFVGAGLGTHAMRQTICREMGKRDPRWSNGVPPPRPGTDPERHAALLRTAGIGRFSIEKEEAGHWIILGG